MNNLKAGFGRRVITPKNGIPMEGYFFYRPSVGVIDDLETNVLALSDGKNTTLLVSVDHCGIKKDLLDDYRAYISKETGIPTEQILIGATHTHTGPITLKNSDDPMISEYADFLLKKIDEAVKEALDDLTDAKMGYGTGEAKNISFGRRYVMKDGTIRTNPGVNNPEISKPLGAVDETVSVLRFDRNDGKQLLFVNFATHPDVVGGAEISADWPGLLRRTLEKTIDNSRCIFFNGALGDVNHVNVHPKGGDFNGMFNDFDDVARGYAHARHIAYVISGGVLQCFEKVNYVDIETLANKENIIRVASNMPKPSEMDEAYRINTLHKEGRDSELPYEGMMLTTVVAEADRMIKLEHGPEFFSMPLTAVKIGPIALISIPGEAFTDVGIGLKASKTHNVVIPLGLTNGCEGYFPMQDSYDEGGYEARSSFFKAGTAEYIIKSGRELLETL